jgi:hypothetical protein
MIASICLITEGRRFESVEAAPQGKWHLLIFESAFNLKSFAMGMVIFNAH